MEKQTILPAEAGKNNSLDNTKTKSISNSKKLALGALTALAFIVIAGGSAFVYAQSNTSTDKTFLDRVAEIAGVDSSKLKNAFKQASKEEIDEKVAEGKLTESQANEIKERIENEEFRGPGFGMRGGRGMMGPNFDDIAEFLGMTNSDLRTAMREDDKTLLTIAKEKGKTEEQLKSFLSAKFDENLAQAVKDERITQAQADQIKTRKDDMISNLMNNTRPKGPMGKMN